MMCVPRKEAGIWCGINPMIAFFMTSPNRYIHDPFKNEVSFSYITSLITFFPRLSTWVTSTECLRAEILKINAFYSQMYTRITWQTTANGCEQKKSSKIFPLPYLKLEKSSGFSSKYLMSLMLTFPTIFFFGPSTTGRPPIWWSRIRLKASRISSLLWMLTTWSYG